MLLLFSFFVFVLSSLVVAFLFSIYIYNIINKISIISFVCAYVRTHAHAHENARKNKAQKKEC